MPFDKDKIKSSAKMVRIAVSDKQAEEMIPHGNEMMVWINALGEVNTNGVKPLVSPLGGSVALRKDEVFKNGSKEDILAGAPDRCGDFFAVPKVVE